MQKTVTKFSQIYFCCGTHLSVVLKQQSFIGGFRAVSCNQKRSFGKTESKNMPGQVVDGKWMTQLELDEVERKRREAEGDKPDDGSFQRAPTAFRSWISADGSTGFPGEKGRYHLYFSFACPWAHRTLIFRKLKGLEDVISASPVDAFMGEYGWTFGHESLDGKDTKDPLYGFTNLHQIYTKAKKDYTGRVSVPVLWDKKQETIVSNESAEIIRMFNSEFKDVADPKCPDFYPENLRKEIDEINAIVLDTVNGGVYKTGFARSQTAYSAACKALFDSLDKLEERLGKQSFLVGETLTEADWRLFTTLLRFDAVYNNLFKCNLRRLSDYPHLSRFVKQLVFYPGIMETVNMTHIKHHYYRSLVHINPFGIIPDGPVLPPPLN